MINTTNFDYRTALDNVKYYKVKTQFKKTNATNINSKNNTDMNNSNVVPALDVNIELILNKHI